MSFYGETGMNIQNLKLALITIASCGIAWVAFNVNTKKPDVRNVQAEMSALPAAEAPATDIAPVPTAIEEPVAPASSFSESMPRGTALVVVRDTFAALNGSFLEDVHSYAEQGDQAAVSAMVDRNFPTAYAFPANSQVVFEGCGYPVDTCSFVIARQQGSDLKLFFKADHLAVDGR